MARKYVANVFRMLRRLTMPFFILVVLIVAMVASDKYGFEEIESVEVQSTNNISLTTPVFSIRRTPELLTSPFEMEKLTTNLDNLLSVTPSGTCLSVAISGEPIYEYQGNIPLNPGSNSKIVTAAASILQLGADYTFKTTLAAEREPNEDGSLLSTDLYVFSGGDPVLMTDAYLQLLPEGYSPIRTSADELADITVGMNILFIQGAVIVNESRYDDQRTVESWSEELKEAGHIGSLSSALLDQGYDGLRTNYSSQLGVEDPPPLIPSSDPAIRFAANFDDLLEARNVIILETARKGSNVALEDLTELLTMESPPLSQIVTQMLFNNDHMTAEMLLKEIGYSRSGEGKTTAGTSVVTEIIRGSALLETGLLVVDGSGLSSGNQATCTFMQKLIDHEPLRPIFKEAFPIASKDGTSANQFIGSDFSNNLQAPSSRNETGAALNGYFTTDEGEEISISFITNVSEEQEWISSQLDSFYQELSGYLSTYSSGLPVEDFGPK